MYIYIYIIFVACPKLRMPLGLGPCFQRSTCHRATGFVPLHSVGRSLAKELGSDACSVSIARLPRVPNAPRSAYAKLPAFGACCPVISGRIVRIDICRYTTNLNSPRRPEH